MWGVVRFESIESIRQYLQPPLVATCGRVDFNRDGSKGVDSTTFSTTLGSYLRNIFQVSCKLTSGKRFHLMRDGLSDFRLTTNQLPVERFANWLWRIVAVWVYLKTLLQRADIFWARPTHLSPTPSKETRKSAVYQLARRCTQRPRHSAKIMANADDNCSQKTGK